ncbi:transglycosylase [Aquitalea magnusonii]|uniref:GlsB/YeaQ/YmgE family stress response membrane protein n=1 Tax=Aquitalea pelogenes TaxID=1293573 RepID=UPI0005F89872|nr:GlsB/YeaQ/YmgE family stress response membrane protein [Aquitalea pelogenes]KJV33581.1 transglycosylase [Aquitalea magnusonii]
MHLFWFLIVGVVAGWLAGLLIKGEGFGLLGDMLIGIIGAYIGGYLFGVLGLSVHGMLGHIIMATAGASALLLVVRLLKRI